MSCHKERCRPAGIVTPESLHPSAESFTMTSDRQMLISPSIVQARAIVAGADLASKAGALVALLHQRAPTAPQQQQQQRSIPEAAASMDAGA